MNRVTNFSMFRKQVVTAAGVIILVASIRIPMYGEGGDSPKPATSPPSASKEDAPAARAADSSPVAISGATLSEGRTAVPSLEQVMDILQAQGQEIAAL